MFLVTTEDGKKHYALTDIVNKISDAEMSVCGRYVYELNRESILNLLTPVEITYLKCSDLENCSIYKQMKIHEIPKGEYFHYKGGNWRNIYINDKLYAGVKQLKAIILPAETEVWYAM